MNEQQEQSIAVVNRNTHTKVWLLILGIIFIAANLRAPITSVGPLISWIRESLNLSNTGAGIITTLPLLAFAAMSPFASRFTRRFGIEKVLLVAMSLLTVGIVVRSISGTASLFTGTLLLGLAISVCNVLMPSLIKNRFPHKIGLMTGVYSLSMNLCGAIASGISVPLALGLGWKTALGCWSALSLLAVLVWLPQLKNSKEKIASVSNAPATRQVSIWRSPLAWKITIFMGFQSLFFYVGIAWFPDILVQRGVSTNTAGWMISLMQFASLPVTFFVPVLAGKMKNQTSLILLLLVLYLSGLFGVFFGGNGWIMPASFIVLGIATGVAFSLVMMFFSLRTRSGQEAAELSGMAQSVGYLLAAFGPTLFGILHDGTGGWTIPMYLLIFTSIILFICGLSAAKNKFV